MPKRQDASRAWKYFFECVLFWLGISFSQADEIFPKNGLIFTRFQTQKRVQVISHSFCVSKKVRNTVYGAATRESTRLYFGDFSQILRHFFIIIHKSKAFHCPILTQFAQFIIIILTIFQLTKAKGGRLLWKNDSFASFLSFAWPFPAGAVHKRRGRIPPPGRFPGRPQRPEGR